MIYQLGQAPFLVEIIEVSTIVIGALPFLHKNFNCTCVVVAIDGLNCDIV